MPSNLDDLIEAARKCPPVEVVFTTPDPDDHCWVCGKNDQLLSEIEVSQLPVGPLYCTGTSRDCEERALNELNSAESDFIENLNSRFPHKG